MNSFEIIAAVSSSLGVLTFAMIFTLLYRSFTQSSLKELATGKRDIELMDSYIYDMQPSTKIRRRVFHVLKAVCFYGVLVLLIPIFVFSLVNQAQGNVTMIRDRALMVVASGSMSQRHENNTYLVEYGLDNQFDTFDMIVLERVDEDGPELYDVIAFVDDTGKNVIHRIIDFNLDGSFVTRGDSNSGSDTYSPKKEDVIGRYTGTRIPVIGAVVMFFQSVGGVVTLFTLIYCLFMLDHFNDQIKREEQKRLEHLCGAIDLDLDRPRAELRAEFVETLYYKGYVYLFNEKGFVGKEEITDEAYLQKSNSAAIRVMNTGGVRSEKEIPIVSEREEETP